MRPLLATLAALAVSAFSLHAVDLENHPGSASMPPKPIEMPAPQAKDFKPVALGAFVDETGKVTSVAFLNGKPAPDDLPAAQCLKQWRFEPVVWEGKPIPFRVQVNFVNMMGHVSGNLAPLPNLPGETHTEDEFGLVKPVALIDPEVQIPLVEQACRGAVEAYIEYVIGPEGIPTELNIKAASSPTALNAALNVLAGQQFKPATIYGQPVRVRYKQATSTVSTAASPEPLQGLTEANDPIYPYERLIADEDGSATVAFTLNPDGSVKSATIKEASHPDFGAALKASVETWLFSPQAAAAKAEREYTHEYSTAALPGGIERLTKLLRKGEKVSSSAAGLSSKPTRTGSGALIIPTEVREAGQGATVTIEFIIDRCGLAQLPRIVEASHPAAGWAAVTWVGSMRFKPMTRNGVPVDLKVAFPISFPKPKPAAPTS